eukprot:5220656-Pyramimonas_sp.AAC.1
MELSNKMKARRRAGDFLATGPNSWGDKLLEVMDDKLTLSDAAKLTENGGQATFLSTQGGKIEGGYTINGE